MSQEIVKFDVNTAITFVNSIDVKEEFQDECYSDNKVCVSETIININTSVLNMYMKTNKIRKYEVLSVDIKTDLPSFEGSNMESDNVKIEDENYPAANQIGDCSGVLLCNHCHQVYQDYCTKCKVLVHILNKIDSYNTYMRVRELPKYLLETRESIGHLGIFTLKVIPEDVRLGPFTGLNSTGLSFRIKEGKFVVSDDKSEFLNWMQYINPAKNIYERNLFPFQYENKLYYCSTRRIQEGEELLVYFGEEYEDNLLKNVAMDFVPITKEDVENVFACTFCCLGFRLKEYLANHKAAYHDEANKMLSAEDLIQCPFCKIYLEAKEYLEHHMDYCYRINNKYSVLPAPEVHKLEVRRRPSQRSETKRWKRGIYKCMQCKFSTMYNADFRHHIHDHYEVKMYKCHICYKRYKAKEILEAHMEKIHDDYEGGVQKYSTCDNFKANIKNRERSLHLRNNEKQCQCSKCKFQTKSKCHPTSQIRHMNKVKYKCANCEFRTNYKTYLKIHMKIKHLMESDYKCTECEYQTNFKSSLNIHMKTKHLKVSDYICAECEYKTNYKSLLELHIKTKHLKQQEFKCAECKFQTNYKENLKVHIKTKHLKQNDYKCAKCEYKTCYKLSLEVHIKAKHLKESDYKCIECGYKTNYKSSLERHIKARHLKLKDYKYKCVECEYKASCKSYLEVHIKTKHLKESDYKCIECEYKTNYKSSLERHVKERHLEQRDYKYKCVECEYKANRKSYLEVHIKTKHLKVSTYKCMMCEYKTNYKSSLERHIKERHVEQKDYKCMECEYKTDRKQYLERHIKAKHLKVSTYKCMECKYKTNYKSSLEVHVKTEHLKVSDYKCTECEFKTNYKSYLQVHLKTKHFR